jgi:ABC-2 type transport system permease protein
VRRLLASELLRFRSRRLVVVLVGGALGGSGVGAVIAAWQSTPPTDEVFAAARAQAEEEFRLCMTSDYVDEEFIDGSLEEFCRENVGNPTSYMPSHLALADLPPILEGIASLTSILGLVVGASVVAASWQTGTISTIFTWEPRRLRWFAARLAVIGAGIFVVTLVIVAFLSTALALAAVLRGSTALTDGWWRDTTSTILRIAVIASVAALIGGAVAAVGRHTSAALGVVFVYTAVLEGLIRAFRPLWSPWLLGDNIVSFVAWQTTEFGVESGSYVLSPGRALLVILGYTTVALALGFTFVRLRDVH